jgi:coiled-coil domain-containing protein 39
MKVSAFLLLLVGDNIFLTMTVSSLEEARKDSDKENNPTEPNKLVKPSYQPKWVSSIIRESRNDDGIQEDTERLLNKTEDVFELSKELLGESDLPDFADDECRELSRQIKLLEAEREKVSKESKDHKERISTMKDHMTTVKQEISHSNHLLSAKNKDISMEAHLIALQDREKARILSDIKDATLKINNEENRLKNIEDDLNGTNKSIEKLKLALNWNQEELEQRVSAAKQYEKDKIDLERYTRGDEVKVKAALLKLERVTKLSIETQALLDNEVTEAQSKHQEVERMTNTFKIEHEDRRKLLQNWQSTIQAMKDRDSDINAISMKYANSSRRLDEQQQEIRNKKGQISTFQTMVDSIKQEIEINEKLLQNRRQERIDAELSFRNVCDQLDQLKRDHFVSLESLQQAKIKSSLSKDGIEQKSKQLNILRNKYDSALKQLEVEKLTVLSKEKATQLYEDRLHEKEEQLKQEKLKIKALQREKFKQSQRLSHLRLEEKNLLSDIKNSHVSISFKSIRVCKYLFLTILICSLNSLPLLFSMQK